jgi:hypothetical protein
MLYGFEFPLVLFLPVLDVYKDVGDGVKRVGKESTRE